MALPNVTIEIQNGELPGLAPNGDRRAGFLLQGPAATGLALLTPRLINSLEDAEELGIDAAYDTAGNVRVHYHLKDFYAADAAGRSLWIMLVPQAVSMTTMVDVAETEYARKLQLAAGGTIRIFGVSRNPADGYVADVDDNGIDADVVGAIGKAHLLGEAMALDIQPARFVLEGVYYDGDAGGLVDLKQRDDNRVAVLLGDRVAGNGSAIGMLLGSITAIPVQRNVGRVKNGAVDAEAMYLGAETIEAAGADVDTIDGKGFISFRKFPGKSGYYFTNDGTATGTNDDYRRLSYGRVIDKAVVLAYQIYVNEILDEIEIDENGRIEAGQAKYYQALISRAVNTEMTANGEISGFSAYVDVDQDVLTTSKFCIEARIRPLGFARDILVKVGFNNPNNA